MVLPRTDCWPREELVELQHRSGINAPTICGSVLAALIAIVINFATEMKYNIWVWAVVILLLVLNIGAALWLARRTAGHNGASAGGQEVVRTEVAKNVNQLGLVDGNLSVSGQGSRVAADIQSLYPGAEKRPHQSDDLGVARQSVKDSSVQGSVNQIGTVGGNVEL
jgi:hypothetical protein